MIFSICVRKSHFITEILSGCLVTADEFFLLYQARRAAGSSSVRSEKEASGPDRLAGCSLLCPVAGRSTTETCMVVALIAVLLRLVMPKAM